MHEAKLFMLLLGCKPKGRNTEQHDIFFGIGSNLKDLAPSILEYWPEAQGKIHIDAWRAVTSADNNRITVLERKEQAAGNLSKENTGKLFFLNLGGYKENEFEEFHYKMLVVAAGLEEAKAKAKQTAFFKHTALKESNIHRVATSHIDDKYGVDVDDIYNVEDILSKEVKEKYIIQISTIDQNHNDDIHLGYLKLVDIK